MRPHRQASESLRCGDAQQTDLGGCVEAQGEEEERGQQRSDDSADVRYRAHAVLQRECRCSYGDGTDDHNGRVSQREHEADSDRAVTFLYQLAGHVVDRGDMICINSVAKAEAAGQKGSSQQHRIAVERDQRPRPSRDIEHQQNAVDHEDIPSGASRLVVEQVGEDAHHWLFSPGHFQLVISGLSTPSVSA